MDLPLVLLGGIRSGGAVQRAMAEGFDFVAMGRALIMEPNLVEKMAQDRSTISGCDACNKCIAEMDRGHLRCVRLEEPGGRDESL